MEIRFPGFVNDDFPVRKHGKQECQQIAPCQVLTAVCARGEWCWKCNFLPEKRFVFFYFPDSQFGMFIYIFGKQKWQNRKLSV